MTGLTMAGRRWRKIPWIPREEKLVGKDLTNEAVEIATMGI
jgi:hypothetical protein